MSSFYMFDLMPILGLAALIISFLFKRRSMKKEEQELMETLSSLQGTEKGN